MFGSESDPQRAGKAEISPRGPGETKSDPWGADEAESSPQDRTSRSPRLGVGGVGAHALGSNEAETSSSELDEAWPGPWGSDEAAVVSLTIGCGDVTLINHLVRIPGYRYPTVAPEPSEE